MADLAAAYRRAGYEDVTTFLASGYVILGSAEPPDPARALETVVEPPEGLVVSGAEVFYLREGKGIETVHKEATTARMLGQVTTRRGLRTVRDMHARFFSD